VEGGEAGPGEGEAGPEAGPQPALLLLLRALLPLQEGPGVTVVVILRRGVAAGEAPQVTWPQEGEGELLEGEPPLPPSSGWCRGARRGAGGSAGPAGRLGVGLSPQAKLIKSAGGCDYKKLLAP
jgi:hypothetical protein